MVEPSGGLAANGAPQIGTPTDKDAFKTLVFILWCGFAVALCVKAAISPHSHTTYPCFISGSQCWWADANMYDFATSHQDYRYSPTFAIVFSPLAWLPIRLGGPLWNLLNVSVLFWSLNVALRDLLPASWTIRQRSLFLLLSLIGSGSALWNSQTNPLIFSMIAAGAAACVRQQWGLAALLLAIPVYIKVWPLAVALLFLACWPLPLLRRFSVATIGLGLTPFLTKPFQTVAWQYANWFHALTGPMQGRHVYRDAWTIWELVHPPVDPKAYVFLQLSAACVVMALTIWRWWSAVSIRQTALFTVALWASWQLLLGPGTERTTICVIVPLMTWGLIESFSLPHRRVLMSAAFALTTLFTFGDLERSLVGPFPAVLAAIPTGVLLFTAWLLAYAWRDERRTLDAPVSGMSFEDLGNRRADNQRPIQGPMRDAA